MSMKIKDMNFLHNMCFADLPSNYVPKVNGKGLGQLDLQLIKKCNLDLKKFN